RLCAGAPGRRRVRVVASRGWLRVAQVRAGDRRVPLPDRRRGPGERRTAVHGRRGEDLGRARADPPSGPGQRADPGRGPARLADPPGGTVPRSSEGHGGPKVPTGGPFGLAWAGSLKPGCGG